MTEIKAQIDDSGCNDEGREAVRLSVEQALQTAGIQAEVRLNFINVTGQVAITCAETDQENAESIAKGCLGIQEVYTENPDDPRIEFMAVRCDPPSEDE